MAGRSPEEHVSKGVKKEGKSPVPVSGMDTGDRSWYWHRHRHFKRSRCVGKLCLVMKRPVSGVRRRYWFSTLSRCALALQFQ